MIDRIKIYELDIYIIEKKFPKLQNLIFNEFFFLTFMNISLLFFVYTLNLFYLYFIFVQDNQIQENHFIILFTFFLRSFKKPKIIIIYIILLKIK